MVKLAFDLTFSDHVGDKFLLVEWLTSGTRSGYRSPKMAISLWGDGSCKESLTFQLKGPTGLVEVVTGKKALFGRPSFIGWLGSTPVCGSFSIENIIIQKDAGGDRIL